MVEEVLLRRCAVDIFASYENSQATVIQWGLTEKGTWLKTKIVVEAWPSNSSDLAETH